MNESPELVRQQTWTSAGPADIDVTIDVGQVHIELTDNHDNEVRVDIRHDPTAAVGFEQGFGGLVSWLVSAAPVMQGQDVAAAAVRAAEMGWQESKRRLVVRSASELPLRMVPLAVTISAPESSTVSVRTGAGDVKVNGRAGRTFARTGSGDVRIGKIDGDADVATGSGHVDLDIISGGGRVRTGSGSIAIAGLQGPANITSSSGAITLGEVSGDLTLRSGTGSVRVDDAKSGSFQITTGSGELILRVHPGVTAELDLSTGSGRAHSDLPVSPTRPPTDPELVIRGRTGSGDVLVTRA